MKRKSQILIVDDETNVRRVLATLLEQAGYDAIRAASAEQALDLVRARDPELVLTDLKMEGMDGMGLLAELQRSFPEIPVVMLTAHGTIEHAVGAMKLGAHDFLTKPFDKEDVIAVVAAALARAAKSRVEFQGPLVPGERCGLIGRSPAMETLKQSIEKVAATPATVLILGETGTGKELVAEALHQLSDRAGKPLIKVNCGALPETLVESELFGHERGAFTGAEATRPGRFELAHEGTLFLDEIGELPPAVQVMLLRVLQDGVIDRVGGTEPRRVDVRLVAATHRDLHEQVEQGRFREDLLYRLKVIELRVPPLREHLDDLPLLLDCFLDKHSSRLGRNRPACASDVPAALTARAWPGNVRELENAVERAILLGGDVELTAGDFGSAPGESVATGPTRSLKEASKAAATATELRMIHEALEATGDNVTHAAERLGLTRRGLQLKLKELGLR